jgi:hypothetical protein
MLKDADWLEWRQARACKGSQRKCLPESAAWDSDAPVVAKRIGGNGRQAHDGCVAKIEEREASDGDPAQCPGGSGKPVPWASGIRSCRQGGTKPPINGNGSGRQSWRKSRTSASAFTSLDLGGAPKRQRLGSHAANSVNTRWGKTERSCKGNLAVRVTTTGSLNAAKRMAVTRAWMGTMPTRWRGTTGDG